MIYDFSSFKLSDDDFEKLSEGSQGIIKQFKILKSGSKIFMDIKKEIEDNYEDREISDEIGCIKLPKKSSFNLQSFSFIGMLITYCKFVDVWDYKKISKFLINNSSNDIFEENHEELKKIRDGYVAHYNYIDIDDISFSYYKEGQKIIPSYFSFNSQPLDCLYIVLLLENIESLKIFINHKIEKLESIFDSKLSDEDRKILLDNQLK